MRRLHCLIPLLVVLVLFFATITQAQWQLPSGSVTYTGNADYAVAIPTAITEAGNVVTITVANTLSPGQSFTLSGVTPAAYNGNYIALTAVAATITALSATAGTAAGTVFGQLQTPAIGPGGLVSTVAGLQIAVAPGPIFCVAGGQQFINSSAFNLNASSTYYVYFRCPTGQLIASTSTPVPVADVLLDTTITGVATITSNTDARPGQSQRFPPSMDFVYEVPLHNCAWSLPTGVLGTASTIGENVGIVRAAAGNPVNQVITTGAANIPTYTCDITPPFVRTATVTGVRGFTVNEIEARFGYQTTAPTSIDTPVLNTVLAAISGAGTAVGTVASVGGTLVQNVGTSHSSPGAVTTTGTCWNETTIPTTPVLVTNPLKRLTFEQALHQTAASITIAQLCGVVLYGSFIY